MRYLSVCSGIAADTVAWKELGWTCAAYSETDDTASAVLAHHYPNVPNHGDFTTIQGDEYGTIDIVVGGTPCQSFSVAGLRKGVDDSRGILTIEFCKLLNRVRPKWFVWENVPGVLSNDGGDSFRHIISEMVKSGYSVAYRVLDAQFVRTSKHPFTVPQRRRRVYAVGHIGDDWRPPVGVLFDASSLRGDAPPRRRKKADCSGTITRYLGTGGPGDPQKLDLMVEHVPDVAAVNHNLSSNPSCFGSMIKTDGTSYTMRSSVKPAVMIEGYAAGVESEVASTLLAGRGNRRNDLESETYVVQDVAKTLKSGGNPRHDLTHDNVVPNGAMVRYLTELECERLQGFGDGHTKVNIKRRGKERPLSKTARYCVLGNAMAVNCVGYIGEKIKLWEEMCEK